MRIVSLSNGKKAGADSILDIPPHVSSTLFYLLWLDQNFTQSRGKWKLDHGHVQYEYSYKLYVLALQS